MKLLIKFLIKLDVSSLCGCFPSGASVVCLGSRCKSW
ncbi:hypothetical protein AAHE18_10G126600 [Arachis hypogaea]